VTDDFPVHAQQSCGFAVDFTCIETAEQFVDGGIATASSEMIFRQSDRRIHDRKVGSSILIQVDNGLLHVAVKDGFLPRAVAAGIMCRRREPNHVLHRARDIGQGVRLQHGHGRNFRGIPPYRQLITFFVKDIERLLS